MKNSEKALKIIKNISPKLSLNVYTHVSDQVINLSDLTNENEKFEATLQILDYIRPTLNSNDFTIVSEQVLNIHD